MNARAASVQTPVYTTTRLVGGSMHVLSPSGRIVGRFPATAKGLRDAREHADELNMAYRAGWIARGYCDKAAT